MKIGVYRPLTQGQFALVDRELYDKVTQYKWYYDKSTGYARRSVKGHASKEYLHQFIIFQFQETYIDCIDHKNRIKLDCRKDNLRAGTHTKNHGNQEKQQGVYSSKYKGVYVPKSGYPTAQIYVNGKTIHLGSYQSEKEAADAYDSAAIVFFGEFANLNCSWLENRV